MATKRRYPGDIGAKRLVEQGLARGLDLHEAAQQAGVDLDVAARYADLMDNANRYDLLELERERRLVNAAAAQARLAEKLQFGLHPTVRKAA